MLLKQEHDPIVSNGMQEGNTFTIAASAKAFEVLSSNLYQDKILAVIREISCNAADAHGVTGRPLSDIKITLPSYLNPTFAVRDFGPGLSKSDVLNLYTKYFFSLKDQDNSSIGGFGLGSKAPFAIADQFTVTSWHGGTKTTYVMYKDSGVPQVSVGSEVPSSEPPGLQVQVAVSGSVQPWLDKAAEFFSWWPALPTFTGASNFSVKFMMDPANIRIRSTDALAGGYPKWAFTKDITYTTTLVAFMGLVPYTLQLAAIPGIDSQTQTFFANKKCVLAFDIGELSISPSREALSYDKSTCLTIQSRIKEIAAEFNTRAQQSVASAKTLYDARELLYGDNGIMRAHISPGVTRSSAPNILWNNKKILPNLGINCAGANNFFSADVTIYGMSFRSYNSNWRYDSGSNILEHSFSTPYYASNQSIKQKYVWFPAITSGVYRLLKYNSSEITSSVYDTNRFIIMCGSTFADVSSKLEEEGFPPIFDGTTLAKAPPTKRSTAIAATTQGYIFDTSLSWRRQEQAIDLAGGGMYISFWDGRPEEDLALLREAINQGWLAKTTNIIGLPKTKLARKKLQTALANNGWQCFGADWVKATVTKQQIEDTVFISLVQNCANPINFTQFYTKYHKHYVANKTNWAHYNALIDSRFASKLNTQPALNYAYNSKAFLPSWFSADHTTGVQNAEQEFTIWQSKWTAFVDTNPLLKYLIKSSWGFANAGDLPPFEVLNDYLSR